MHPRGDLPKILKYGQDKVVETHFKYVKISNPQSLGTLPNEEEKKNIEEEKINDEVPQSNLGNINPDLLILHN